MPNYQFGNGLTGEVIETLLLGVTDMQKAITNMQSAITSISTALGTLTNSVGEASTIFTEHQTTDVTRWAHLTEVEQRLNDLSASVENAVPDIENTVNIEDAAQGNGFIVNNTLGGRIDFTGVTLLLIPASVSINGVLAWSSSGLIGVGSGSRLVNNGDEITCSSITTITFTPYKGKDNG